MFTSIIISTYHSSSRKNLGFRNLVLTEIILEIRIKVLNHIISKKCQKSSLTFVFITKFQCVEVLTMSLMLIYASLSPPQQTTS